MISDFPQTILEAKIFQDRIAKNTILEDQFSKIKTIGAFDISIKPDLILIDGHGIAHPKNTGSATVFGVLTEIPSIGVAKKPLKFFNYKQTELEFLKQVILNKNFVGYRYQPKTSWNPVFISPGNKVSVKSSFTLVQNLFKKSFKLPFPLHKAHNLATEFRKSN